MNLPIINGYYLGDYDIRNFNGNINLSTENPYGGLVNVIEPNLLASEMRLQMEDKKLLSGYGDIYMGTGVTQTVNFVYQGGSKQINVPITAALKAPTDFEGGKRYMLVIDGDNGLHWEEY